MLHLKSSADLSSVISTIPTTCHLAKQPIKQSTLNHQIDKLILSLEFSFKAHTSINTLTLDTVLVVPSLEYNLLSVSQITSTLACTIIFWPTFCVFQDILTRKILGYGVRRGKLYYLELTENEGLNISQANQATNEDRIRANVWLCHRRLGHLSFGYLKKLQPHLFSTLNDLYFHCDICEMAKSHRTSYLPSLNKSLEPFVVIHSYV